jgi:hypothetical protein
MKIAMRITKMLFSTGVSESEISDILQESGRNKLRNKTVTKML